MKKQRKKNTRMLILFIFGFLFLNYPLLSLFSSKNILIAGIPLLYAFVYILWGVLIVITIFTIGLNKDNSSSNIH